MSDNNQILRHQRTVKVDSSRDQGKIEINVPFNKQAPVFNND